ncbi:MAG TPA: hypothetical protein VFQ41_13265 [Candidatus Angelobacter sp.]|nr:hypothetical protein [Candidatus Angelobacter sp.]
MIANIADIAGIDKSKTLYRGLPRMIADREGGLERQNECRALPLFDPAGAARGLIISSEWPR